MLAGHGAHTQKGKHTRGVSQDRPNLDGGFVDQGSKGVLVRADSCHIRCVDDMDAPTRSRKKYLPFSIRVKYARSHMTSLMPVQWPVTAQ